MFSSHPPPERGQAGSAHLWGTLMQTLGPQPRREESAPHRGPPPPHPPRNPPWLRSPGKVALQRHCLAAHRGRGAQGSGRSMNNRGKDPFRERGTDGLPARPKAGGGVRPDLVRVLPVPLKGSQFHMACVGIATRHATSHAYFAQWGPSSQVTTEALPELGRQAQGRGQDRTSPAPASSLSGAPRSIWILASLRT